MRKLRGLTFQKFDLHVHTPASHDFGDKSVKPEQIVDRALKAELRGIAITDHNAGDFIEKVKEAAKGKQLAVFPGVEITCSSGEGGIHIIAILDVNKGKKHIDAILAQLDINPDDFGKKTTATPRSSYDVINTISKNNGLAILAHCTSSKGVLHDIKGSVRKTIFENPGLSAVETSENDFTNPEKEDKRTRACDLLNGENEDYNFRKIGIYIASDSKRPEDAVHTLEGLGSKYTYLKVDEDVNLESLRQCFIDRDVRIRQCFEFKENFWPYIKGVAITGGFFDKQDACFHNGLNSILGAKGAGKSLLVELLKFGLNQSSSNLEINDDHQRKLEKRLDTYGTLKITFVDETGAEETVVRTFNPEEGSPYDDEDQESLVNAFPVLFLSQNEIVRIAEDEREQIAFIDKFFDFRHYTNRIKNIEKDLVKLDESFATSLRAINDLTDIENQLKKNTVELKKVDKLLSDPIYNKYKTIEAKDTGLKKQFDAATEIKKYLLEQLNYVKLIKLPVFEGDLSKDPVIRRNCDTLLTVKTEIYSSLDKAEDKVNTAITSIETEYKKWFVSFSEEKKVYEDHVRSAGGNKKELEKTRLKIVKEVEDLTKRKNQLTEDKANLKSVNAGRDSLIKKLFKVYKEYSEERKNKCLKFEKESNGRLKVTISESTNINEFKKQLNDMKTGSYLRSSDVDEICLKITPYEFILNLLRYQATKDIKYLKTTEEKIELDFDKLFRLCEFLLSDVKYEQLLRLQYKAHPQDRPEIRFRVSEERFELVKDISVGQKCTAMLVMALSDGRFPIVIDQPEDSLDVRSIWEDMCVKIRQGKENRQFIFTTHNSCLAVASDTDKFTIIESDANSGKVVISGALDSDEVKGEVIKYLEGGRITYFKKYDKYGLKDYGMEKKRDKN